MGSQKVANWLQFYRRSFDVDSKSVKIFEFRPPGTSECRFYWFWPSLIEFKSQFLPDDKNIFKTRLKRTFFVRNFLLNFFLKVDSVPSGTTNVKNLRPWHGHHGRGHGYRCGETAESLIRRTREYIRCLSVVRIFQKNLSDVCPMSGFCPKFLKKALSFVGCSDFRCPWLPTSDAIHNLLTINPY